jgi:hypothetical protein
MKLLGLTELATDVLAAGSVGCLVLSKVSSLRVFPGLWSLDMGCVHVRTSGGLVRAVAVLTVAFLIAGYGCGSGNEDGQVSLASKNRASKDTLTKADLYRYEGEGRAKRKIALSTTEINKVLYEKKAGKPGE